MEYESEYVMVVLKCCMWDTFCSGGDEAEGGRRFL